MANTDLYHLGEMLCEEVLIDVYQMLLSRFLIDKPHTTIALYERYANLTLWLFISIKSRQPINYVSNPGESI